MLEKDYRIESIILKRSIQAITAKYGLDKEEVKDLVDATSLTIKKNLYEMERNIK